MKYASLCTAPAIILLVVTMSGCPITDGAPHDSNIYQTFSADTVTFKFTFVTGTTFPTQVDDSGTTTVGDNFWMGETEVTYELWNAVCTWAGGNSYNFSNTGSIGRNDAGSVQQPVTMINWRDCMVFCNAATEWYNARTGTSYGCVYKDGGVPIRDSRDINAAQCDGVAPDMAANGFRLPFSDEWELAARWRNDAANTVTGYANPWFTQGDSASGATADSSHAAETHAVAWYNGNSGGDTHAVKGLSANSLGLYDMSGNVWEFCFDLVNPSRIYRGGSLNLPPDFLMMGEGGLTVAPDSEDDVNGLRLARSID